MACPIPTAARTYPLRKPQNHTLPVPRYTLTLPSSVANVHTVYIGLQTHSTTSKATTAAKQVTQCIKEWISTTNCPAHETFILIDSAGGENPGTRLWVCYWNDTTAYKYSLASLDLTTMHATLPSDSRSETGLWLETFTTPVSRIETNYSGTDYLPGLARLPSTKVVEHDLATYWGAARDRIPDSAHDLFPRPQESRERRGAQEQVSGVNGLGEVLHGTNAHNMVHIRSGQWWENCNSVEASAYEEKLEPTLRKGLAYLNEHQAQTGCMGVRYLRNVNDDGKGGEGDAKETCGAGFFHNLEDLERWSKTHMSHLKIWKGALSHYKAFPDNRMLRTWHEVSVIKEGDARWEYVNCRAGTGVTGSAKMNRQSLNL